MILTLIIYIRKRLLLKLPPKLPPKRILMYRVI